MNVNYSMTFLLFQYIPCIILFALSLSPDSKSYMIIISSNDDAIKGHLGTGFTPHTNVY